MDILREYLKLKYLSKAISLVTVFAIVFGIGQVSIAGSTFPDIKGHWAEDAIQKGVDKGLVNGYSDGTFKPNRPVTRAEFSKMLNLALGTNLTENISLSDVKSKDWYYDEVRKAVAAGYITGYTDKTFKPNNEITRQEAANMISKVLPNYGISTSLSGLKDDHKIASWAKAGVTAVYARGYMTGDSNKMYRPEGSLTRGEACAILIRLVEGENIITASNYIIDDDDEGDTISKKIFANNVTIDEDLEDGDITLDKVIILGSLTIEGGGESTVEISDSIIKNMIVSKTSGDVRILLTEDSVVNDTLVKYGAIIEQKSLTGDGFKKIRLNGGKLSTQEVILKGNFTNVELEDEALLELSSGKITILTINSGAGDSIIDLASGTSITTAEVNGRADFTGSGKISTMKANVNSITYETKPSTITKGSGVTKPPVLAEDNDGPIATFTPKADGTNVTPDTKITLEFDEAIYLSGGDKVNVSDIEDIIEIRKSSSTGTEIDYTATISSDKRVITITPTEVLSTSTYYYVIVLAGTIEDIEENENDKQSSKFKTGNQDVAPPTVSFSPLNNATNISVDTKITLTFSESIRLTGGDTVTNSNITNFIELREGSATGTKKSFKATINSTKKTIEIAPSAALTVNKDYYVIVLAGKIEDADGNDVTKTTSTFKTGLPLASSPTIATNPTSVSAVANNGVVTVTLSTSTSDGNIYYTTDGSTPTSSSKHYTTPFEVTNNLVAGQVVTIKAVTIKSGMTNSTVVSKAITFISNQVATPTITTNPSDYTDVPSNQSVSVTLGSTTSGTTIYYTTDNSTPVPNATDSIQYNGAFSVLADDPSGDSVTIKAIAVREGMVNSTVVSKTITFSDNRVKAPSISANPSGDVSNEIAVTISMNSATSGVTIRYTTDGTEPTTTSSKYTGAFSLNATSSEGGTVTIKAIAIKEGMVNSSISTKTVKFLPE